MALLDWDAVTWETFTAGVRGYRDDFAPKGREDAAYLAALRAGYRLDHPLHPGIAAWGELLSGDGREHTAFDTLYGSNHAYYGEMDVFATLPVDTRFYGLMDVGARLESGLASGLSAEVDGHWFRTAKQPPGPSSRACSRSSQSPKAWNVEIRTSA